MSRSSRAFSRVLRGTLAVGFVAAVAIAAPLGGGGRVIEAAGEALGAGGEYHALTPERILDTRDPAKDVAPAGAKTFATDNALATGFNLPVVPAVARDGMPAFVDSDGDCNDDNVLAVAVNITVAAPTAVGHLTAYGAGTGQDVKKSSILNFQPGQALANTAILRPGCNGELTIQMYNPVAAANAHVIIDVFGWFSSSSFADRGARLEPVTPNRIFDTREASGGNAPIGGGTSRRVQVRGTATVPDNADVVGVMVNLTGVNTPAGRTNTHLSLLPAQPTGEVSTSNLNLVVNQVRANLAIVPLSDDGAIWVYNNSGNAHAVLDVVGYFVKRPDTSTRGRVVPLVAPFRAFDTRDEAHGDQPLPSAYAEDWNFTDFANDVKVNGAPVGAQIGVVGNLTVAELQRQYSWGPPTQSYLTAYPTPAGGEGPPNISNLNMVNGEGAIPNLALLTYGVGQQVRFYNLAGQADYLYDASAVILA